MKTLSIVGCGKAGRTLGRLWTRHGVLRIGQVLNRSLQSGSEAVRFMGAGCAVRAIAELTPADFFLIATPDEAIESTCAQLAAGGVLSQETIVFHLSGALPSTVLGAAKRAGAQIASIHPVKSFADPGRAAKTFSGTFCGVEGDRPACDVLEGLFKQIGAWTFRLATANKTIYHAATVIVCNYLVALVEVGLRCLEHAGLARQQAMELIRPIVTETTQNIFTLGPSKALTGPIVRGDAQVVGRQCEALDRWQRSIACVYRALGEITVELARASGQTDPAQLERICSVLRRLPAPGADEAQR